MEQKRFKETTPVVINANTICDIDTGCLSFVEFFNSIGLITKFSCYGHRSYEKFYIMFDERVTLEMIEEFIRIIGMISVQFYFSLWSRLLFPGVNNTLLARNVMMTINLPIENKFNLVSSIYKDIINEWNRYESKHISDMFLQYTLDAPVDISVLCPYCQERTNHHVIKIPSVIQNRCSCGKIVHSIITDLENCEN